MKFDESVEDFHDRFLHFCYEFLEDDIDWNFMKEKFQCIVQLSLNPPEPESLSSVLALLSHWDLKVSKEEPNLSCDSPSNEVAPCVNVKDEKLQGQIDDPIPFPPSPHNQVLNSHFKLESDLINEISFSGYITRTPPTILSHPLFYDSPNPPVIVASKAS